MRTTQVCLAPSSQELGLVSNFCSVVMRRRGPAVAPPNNMFERAAGSHPLAAAAQHARWADGGIIYGRTDDYQTCLS